MTGDDFGAGRGPAWLEEFLAGSLPDLIALRREVHALPELSDRETATTARIGRALAAAGIAVDPLPGGTGAVGEVAGGAGPTIALRADIDALPIQEATGLPFASTVPGVAHACGHDVHLTTVVGAALALQRCPDLPGPVRLLFQPAEEVMGDGPARIMAAGGLTGVDRIIALHCDPRLAVGSVGLKSGFITSTCDFVELEVTGPGGHTSRPHLTADVIYALGAVVTELPGLLTRRLDPRAAAVLVFGVVEAGRAPNAIPQRGLLRGTLRLMDRAAWDGVEPLVRELVAQILAPTGVAHTLTYSRGVPPVDNDADTVALLSLAATQALGPAAVAPTAQSSGAEDFALYLDRVPGALARLGVWDGVGPMVDLHSARFTVDERAIAVGVRLLVATVLAAGGRGAQPTGQVPTDWQGRLRSAET